MNYEMLLVSIILVIIENWFFKDAWINPEKFLDRINQMKEDHLLNYSAHISPRFEIWTGRFGFVFVFGVIIFCLYHSFN
jgi:hypothetical protein